MTENATGLGAPARGSLKTCLIARFKYFLPMYPLGHNVSETSSTGMIRGDSDECIDLVRKDCRLQALARRENNSVMVVERKVGCLESRFSIGGQRHFSNFIRDDSRYIIAVPSAEVVRTVGRCIVG
jgi:hypothetical protein